MIDTGIRKTYADLEAENTQLREQITTILRDALDPEGGYAWQPPDGIAWIGCQLAAIDALVEAASAYTIVPGEERVTAGEVSALIYNQVDEIRATLPDQTPRIITA